MLTGTTIESIDATHAPAGPDACRRNQLLRAVGYGTLVSGVLDATDGVIAFGLLGMNPIQVLQYIASGAFGPAAFEGGLVTAAAGAVFHFLIALVAAAVYVTGATRLTVLRRQWIAAGLLYGMWVWGFMAFGVLPLTRVTAITPTVPLLLNGVIGHAIFVGLPIAYFARRVGNSRM